MYVPRNFRKCETCGAPGHGGRDCPLFELNQMQERQSSMRRRDSSIGLTPELEEQIARIRSAWRAAAVQAAMVLALCVALFGGTITGQLQTSTGGVIQNATLGFKLSQPAVLSGTASVVTQQAFCYLSTLGNIVGLPDPLALPVVNTNTLSGTLGAGTYFVKVTYFGAGGETVASPETSVVLSATGTLILNAPILQPPSATGYKVYISATAGTETLQATVTGFGQYQQAAALAAGTALPASNSTVCTLAFSDQLIPTGTYYLVSLTSKTGGGISGFPQTWCTFGGQSGTINVSNGAPTGNCGSNGVFYPTPILANPTNNAQQSISGPLFLPGGISGITSFFSGILSPFFSSILPNPAASGVVRLAAGDTACWRNQANSADVCISKNGSDQLALTNPLLVPNLIDNALPPTSPVCTDVNKQLTGLCVVTSVPRGFSVAGGGSDVAAGSTAMALVLDPNTAGATYSYVNPTATDIGEGQVTSSAAAGHAAFFAASANVVGFATFQSFIAHAKLVTTANVRVWIGITDASFPTGLQADAPLLHQAMFRYSTSAGDLDWQCYASNGVAFTVVNSGVAIDTNPHQFAVALSGGTLTYSIDGTARCTINTNVPAGANNGTPALSVDNISLGNAVSLDGSYFFWTNTQ